MFGGARRIRRVEKKGQIRGMDNGPVARKAGLGIDVSRHAVFGKFRSPNRLDILGEYIGLLALTEDPAETDGGFRLT
jgi:hypothetical protein